MSSTIGVQNIAHTNGTVAATVDSGGNIAMASGKTFSATGAVLQVKNFQTGALITGTATIPFDNTIPQITEGFEVMTLAFTPTSSSSKLLISVVTQFSPSVDSLAVTALFVGTTANALATSFTHTMGSGSYPLIHSFNHYMTSGSTSELTFRVRIGSNNAGTTTFNGRSGAVRYGGSLASSITITEIGG